MFKLLGLIILCVILFYLIYLIGFILLVALAAVLSSAVLIWPVFNFLAYLKVLFFPWPVRKKYGSSLELLSSDSFEQEITTEDQNEIGKLNAHARRCEKQWEILFTKREGLGTLDRNKDGSINQRSNAGKEAVRLELQISEMQDKLRDAEAQAKAIKDKPFNVWSDWSKRYARYTANRNALILMFFGFPIFFMLVAKSDFLGLQELLGTNYQAFGQVSTDTEFDRLLDVLISTVDIYIYMVYVAPMSILYDLFVSPDASSLAVLSGTPSDVFKEWPLLISYDYSASLTKNYYEAFSLINWVKLTVPMPLFVLIYYLFSFWWHQEKAKAVAPNG